MTGPPGPSLHTARLTCRLDGAFRPSACAGQTVHSARLPHRLVGAYRPTAPTGPSARRCTIPDCPSPIHRFASRPRDPVNPQVPARGFISPFARLLVHGTSATSLLPQHPSRHTDFQPSPSWGLVRPVWPLSESVPNLCLCFRTRASTVIQQVQSASVRVNSDQVTEQSSRCKLSVDKKNANTGSCVFIY